MSYQYLRVLPDGTWQQTFVSDLVWEIVKAIRYPIEWDSDTFPLWEDYDAVYGQRITRTSLWSCCLVCREWHELFTPALYEMIVIDKEKMGTHLFRTLLHHKPSYKRLIRAIEVECHNSPHGWTPILAQLPNLHNLTMHQFNLAHSHPELAPFLRFLPNGCDTRLYGEEVLFHPQLLPRTLRFIRSSQPNCLDLVIRFSPSSAPKLEDPLPPNCRYLPDIYLTATATIGKCQTVIIFPWIRKDEDITSVNLCLGYLGQHLERLALIYRGPMRRTIDFNLWNNHKLRSLQLKFAEEANMSNQEEWKEVLPWFESLCSTVDTESKSLQITIASPPDDSVFCEKIEDILLSMKRDGRALDLSVELGNLGVTRGDKYWMERFPRLHKEFLVIGY